MRENNSKSLMYSQSKYLLILLSLLILGLLFLPTFAAGHVPDQANAAGQGDAASAGPVIDPDVAAENGETTMVIRLDELSGNITSPDQLKTHAQETQQPVVEQLERLGPVNVTNQLWLTNAIVVEADLNQIPIERIAAVDSVQAIQSNPEVEIDGAATSASSDVAVHEPSLEGESDLADASWNVDRMNTPEAWAAYDTHGDGSKVAVLDTGIEADHEDIDLYTTDPTDPTYPGGWAVIDSSGNVVDDPGSPFDDHGHGTRISGLAAAGDESGEFIGVAPGADLIHGQIAPDGSTSFAQIIGGLEWAVSEDADVASISFGAEGYYSHLIEPIRNAEQSGTLVVGSIGNNGEGTSTTPGNEYDSLGVGSTDYWDDVSSFSGGERINTDDAWGSNAPSDWPDEYIAPQLVVPAEQVMTTHRDNSHGSSSGTSAAAPQVSGAIAVVQSATTDEHTPEQLKAALTETANHPDGPDIQDNRYGHGMVDVLAAIGYLEDQESAEFDIASVELSDKTILEGETARITAEVTNTGDTEGEFTAEFSITDASGSADIVDTETVLLSSGETTTVTLTAEIERAGEYDAALSGTDAGTLTVERPPTLELSDGSLDEEVITTDESVGVTATAENIGDRSGTFDIGLLVDDKEVSTTDILLESEESSTVYFEYEPTEAGEYHITVEGDSNDGDRVATAAGTVAVNTPADIEVTDATLSSETIVEDESTEVVATVTNHGGTAGTSDVALEVDGTPVDSTEVKVEGGSSTTVSFEKVFSTSGKYEVTVDGANAGTLTVEQPAVFEANDAWMSKSVIVESESVDVSAEIENTGDITGIFSAELVVDGTTEKTTDIELEGEESGVVSFTFEPESAGEYEIAIGGADNDGGVVDVVAGTVLVERPAEISVTEATVEDSELTVVTRRRSRLLWLTTVTVPVAKKSCSLSTVMSSKRIP